MTTTTVRQREYLLRELRDHGPLTVRDLSDRTGLSMWTINTVMPELRKVGSVVPRWLAGDLYLAIPTPEEAAAHAAAHSDAGQGDLFPTSKEVP